jgi:hypothetical protein
MRPVTVWRWESASRAAQRTPVAGLALWVPRRQNHSRDILFVVVQENKRSGASSFSLLTRNAQQYGVRDLEWTFGKELLYYITNLPLRPVMGSVRPGGVSW